MSSRRVSRRGKPFRAIFAAGAAAATLALTASPAAATGIGIRGAWGDTPEVEENTQMIGGFFRLGSKVAVEAAVDYRGTNLGDGAEVRTWPATVSLLISPIPYVYGLAGIGWYNTTVALPPAFNGVEETWREFGYHAGAGVQLPVVQSVSFVGDLRYSYVGYEFDEFADALSDFDGGDYLALNLGLMVHLPSRN